MLSSEPENCMADHSKKSSLSDIVDETELRVVLKNPNVSL